MSKTKIHKIEAKIKAGLIDYETAPENLKRKWHRHNFAVGEYRNERNIKIEKQFENSEKIARNWQILKI